MPINIRVGNPVLFPICGPLQNNEYIINGSVHSLKQHGFARIKAWTVEKVEPFKITVGLEDDEETRRQHPFHFRLRFTYELKDAKQSIHQVYENLSEDVCLFMLAFTLTFLVNIASTTIICRLQAFGITVTVPSKAERQPMLIWISKIL